MADCMNLNRLSLAVIAVTLTAAHAHAVCRVGKDTNEAKLLAFYSVPMIFSVGRAPSEDFLLRIGGEGEPIPKPDPSIQRSGECFTSKTEHTSLSPAFGRPRIALRIPGGFAIEGSYLPPVTIADATPNLGSVAVGNTTHLRVSNSVVGMTLRGYYTFGSVKGPITCPRGSLQSNSSEEPCYGSSPSKDTFHPNAGGVDLIFSGWDRAMKTGLYVGAAENFLRPRFQVGFTDATGHLDNTLVEVNLNRTGVFAGVTRKIASVIDVSAEVYSVPVDVMTFRVGASWKLR
jgi:hypothetical protein